MPNRSFPPPVWSQYGKEHDEYKYPRGISHGDDNLVSYGVYLVFLKKYYSRVLISDQYQH